MNGLELASGFYEAFGKPMLESEFPELIPLLAVGFTGSGSEHYGYDDAISQDHDFEPGFSIFLPGEHIVDRRRAFQLERAYAKLPKEYAGFRRQPISPVGGARNGVIRTEEFFLKAVGSPDGNLSAEQWLTIPDYALAEAVNGVVFSDPYGEVTEIRARLRQMPEDIRLKRIAGSLLLMAQAGQYNYARCLKHGEPEAAQLACTEFVRSAMKVYFLLHHEYLPFYKWSFRALRQLEGGAILADHLSVLLSGENRENGIALKKADTIERIAADTVALLQKAKLTQESGNDLERHAYSVQDRIADGYVRNLHILAGAGE